jgi:hypothetical protein
MSWRFSAVVLMLLASPMFAQEGPVYSVCELLANLSSFQGRTVRVKGVVASAEGAWLVGDSCEAQVRIEGASLVKAIFLTYQSMTGKEVPRNTAHIQAVERRLARMYSKRDSKDLELIYTGIFETRDVWMVMADGRIRGLGHLNAFPAQLVIIDISDPPSRSRREKATERR